MTVRLSADMNKPALLFASVVVSHLLSWGTTDDDCVWLERRQDKEESGGVNAMWLICRVIVSQSKRNPAKNVQKLHPLEGKERTLSCSRGSCKFVAFYPVYRQFVRSVLSFS